MLASLTSGRARAQAHTAIVTIFPAAFLTAESTSEGCRKRPVNGPIVCQLFRWDVATDYRDK